MKFKQWLENWDMTSLKINVKFLEAEWQPQTADQDAAWDLYVELLTRTATQPLPVENGDVKTALDSVHQLFPLTREVLRHHGRDCSEFTKIAVIVLNQVVRPFTTKWHKRSIEGIIDDPHQCETFRSELTALQSQLKKYTRMLANMADVEDFTELEEP